MAGNESSRFEDLGPRVQRGVQWAAGRSLNHAAVAALRLGLPFPPYPADGALVMETFGRRTGRRRLVPMGCLKDGDRVLVVAEHGRTSDWLRNALAAPGAKVRVWLAGRPRMGLVHILEGEDPDQLLARMGNKLHTATIRAMAHDPCVVAIDLVG
jgi:deazaflavin-dependent oxidoreductase (nitroreductase family)